MIWYNEQTSSILYGKEPQVVFNTIPFTPSGLVDNKATYNSMRTQKGYYIVPRQGLKELLSSWLGLSAAANHSTSNLSNRDYNQLLGSGRVLSNLIHGCQKRLGATNPLTSTSNVMGTSFGVLPTFLFGEGGTSHNA